MMSLVTFPEGRYYSCLFISPVSRMEDVLDASLYRCICTKRFRSKSGFWGHKKKCDKVPKPVETRKNTLNKCCELDCSFSAPHSKGLRAHLQSDHNIQMEKETKTFGNYQDFVDWKERYERETVAAFTFQSARKNKEEEVKYYYCNRSGHYESQSTGKRKKKAYGTRKVDTNCTASLKVKVKSGGLVSVDICHTHYGHENELCHVPIPNSERLKIAATLHQGVSRERILDDLYEPEASTLERKHLIHRRDINNIAKAFGVNSTDDIPETIIGLP